MSKPEEDLPTFLRWVAESYMAMAEASDDAEEIDALLGSAEMARDHIAAYVASILAAKAEEREAVEPLTVAVAAVVAEAETFTMTMRRRRIFEAMKDRLYAYRNRLAMDDVNTAHKNSEVQ